MTEKESKEWDEAVQRLEKSEKLEENIASILMDAEVAGNGIIETTSIEKAKAIVAFLENKNRRS